MSTLYENLLTAGVQPASNETLKGILEHTWASAIGLSASKPNLGGANPTVTSVHVAVWLSNSADCRERMLSPDQVVQFSNLVNIAKLKVISMFKMDVNVAAMRVMCDNSMEFLDDTRSPTLDAILADQDNTDTDEDDENENEPTEDQ